MSHRPGQCAGMWVTAPSACRLSTYALPCSGPFCPDCPPVGTVGVLIGAHRWVLGDATWEPPSGRLDHHSFDAPRQFTQPHSCVVEHTIGNRSRNPGDAYVPSAQRTSSVAFVAPGVSRGDRGVMRHEQRPTAWARGGRGSPAQRSLRRTMKIIWGCGWRGAVRRSRASRPGKSFSACSAVPPRLRVKHFGGRDQRSRRPRSDLERSTSDPRRTPAPGTRTNRSPRATPYPRCPDTPSRRTPP